MAKTNFTKAEEALVGALQKMQVEELLEKADAASGKGSVSVIVHARTLIINIIKHDLKRLHKLDKEIYKKLDIKQAEIEELMSNPSTLTKENWKKIVLVKSRLDAYIAKLPKVSNEQLVLEQRHKHINKRFNVNDKWLPLK